MRNGYRTVKGRTKPSSEPNICFAENFMDIHVPYDAKHSNFPAMSVFIQVCTYLISYTLCAARTITRCAIYKFYIYATSMQAINVQKRFTCFKGATTVTS